MGAITTAIIAGGLLAYTAKEKDTALKNQKTKEKEMKAAETAQKNELETKEKDAATVKEAVSARDKALRRQRSRGTGTGRRGTILSSPLGGASSGATRTVLGS